MPYGVVVSERVNEEMLRREKCQSGISWVALALD